MDTRLYRIAVGDSLETANKRRFIVTYNDGSRLVAQRTVRIDNREGWRHFPGTVEVRSLSDLTVGSKVTDPETQKMHIVLATSTWDFSLKVQKPEFAVLAEVIIIDGPVCNLLHRKSHPFE